MKLGSRNPNCLFSINSDTGFVLVLPFLFYMPTCFSICSACTPDKRNEIDQESELFIFHTSTIAIVFVVKLEFGLFHYLNSTDGLR